MKKVAEGYDEGLYREYEKGVEALEAVEAEVLKEGKVDVGTSGAGQIE